MKYTATLPFTALCVISLIYILTSFQVIPSGFHILEQLKASFENHFFLLIFAIILAESIVYVGFYFPGQFFAVVLVVLSKPTMEDIIYLTCAMVIAATVGSLINFLLGKHISKERSDAPIDTPGNTSIKHLLLAMIHINSLAFFMFAQGANGKSMKIIGLAGLLNLPYYLLLIIGTSVLSEEVMQLAENTILLVTIISIWLTVAIYIDLRKYRKLPFKST